MEYPIVLGIVAVYFGVLGILALRKKELPEPPPKGGIGEQSAEIVSFQKFYQARAEEREKNAMYAKNEREAPKAA